MLARCTPSSTIRSRQAIAAAPAPETAILTSPIFLPTSSRPLSSAAAEMIAVPCWSSWKTGIFMRSRSFFSIVEALGRLDVLEVDAAQRRLERGDDLDQLVGVVLGELDVEHVDAGELLEQAALAFHHRLAGERADVAEAEHRGAVGDDADQVAARGVFGGERRIGLDRQAGVGDARRVGERQVALVRQRLGRRHRDLAVRRQAVVVERRVAQGLFGSGKFGVWGFIGLDAASVGQPSMVRQRHDSRNRMPLNRRSGGSGAQQRPRGKTRSKAPPPAVKVAADARLPMEKDDDTN